MKRGIVKGSPHPLGATLAGNTANFSIFSKDVTAVELLLFDRAESRKPSHVVPLDPVANRTYHYWHAAVSGVESGQLYGYRVHGPQDPSRGMRFDPRQILLDPYGRAIVTPMGYDRATANSSGTDCSRAMKNAVVRTPLPGRGQIRGLLLCWSLCGMRDNKQPDNSGINMRYA